MRLFLFGFGELLVEAVDASILGDEALLAGVEGMAVGAGVDLDFVEGRSGLEGAAAGRAGDLAGVIRRVDVLFHVQLLSPCWLSRTESG